MIEVPFASSTEAKSTEQAPSVGNIQNKSADEDKNKRRSKWDQTVPGSSSIQAGQKSAQSTLDPTDDNKTATSDFGTLLKKSKLN